MTSARASNSATLSPAFGFDRRDGDSQFHVERRMLVGSLSSRCRKPSASANLVSVSTTAKASSRQRATKSLVRTWSSMTRATAFNSGLITASPQLSRMRW